jgi:hypothetical protein
MSPEVTRWLVTGAFAMHGLGMVGASGYLPWSIRSEKGDFIRASWVLGSGALAAAIGVAVWLVAGAGFLAAVYGFWQGAPWWRVAAWIGSAATLIAIALWVRAVPFGVYVGGALAVGTIAYLLFSR